MASRIDSSQNRNLYVGTGTEVAVNDGNAIVTGNVGIGTTSPGRPLTINSDNADKAIRILENDSANESWDIGVDVDGDLNFFNSADTSPSVTFLDNGNVGIGNANPSRNLTVGDGSGNSVLAIVAATNGLSQIGLGDSDDDNYGQIILRHSDGLLQIQNGGGGGISERGLNITSSENVGIGVAGPDSRLTVSSGTTNAVANFKSTDAAAYIAIADNSSTNALVNQIGVTGNDMWFATDDVERMRINSAGAIKFNAYDSTNKTGTPTYILGTDASGNVVKVLGGDIPGGGGTVTGSGSATQVAFWDGTSSIAGNDNLYWDSTNNHLGIGDSTPGSRLKVLSGTSETSIYTVDIRHERNDANVSTHAMRLNVDLSGADTTTGDRTNSGLYIDIDSSANGDASNEHRIYGVNSTIHFTGFTDLARGGYFLAESNYTGAKTAQLVGVYGYAIHDVNNAAGGVSNMYGAYGYSSIQDTGDVDNAFGVYGLVNIGDNRVSDVGVTKGVEGEISIDKSTALNYGTMIGISSIIDNNEGSVPNFGDQYLFKGDYQGTKGATAWGIYTEGDKNYFEGKVGIGTTSSSYKLSVQDSVNNADVGININNSFDDNLATSNPNAVVFLNAASNNGYLRVHGAPANTAAKHQIDLGSTAGSSFLTFSPSGEKMRITNDGNVGIGTNDPLSQLSIGSNAITTKKPTVIIADGVAGGSLVIRGLSPILSFDRTGASPENKILMDGAGLEFKTGTLDAEGDVDFKINPDGSLQLTNGSQISNQENTDIDSAAAEVVAQVAISYTAAFFDFVVKKGTNVRSGTVYACHDGTNVEFTETSTNDLGDTSDVTLSVDKTSTNLRLIATVTSDDWSVKSLIRAI